MKLCVTGYNPVSTKGVNPTIATRQNVINTDVNKYISTAFKCPKVKQRSLSVTRRVKEIKL